MEKAFNKQQVISELVRSPHGDLKEYLPVGRAAGESQPEFLAHLVAWNSRKGQIRDSKAALPVISLATTNDPAFRENALAHLAALGPREFSRALAFGRTVPGTPSRTLRRLVERYLREREAQRGFWDRTAVQHRQTLKTLYSQFHIKPDTEFRNLVLYGRTFEKVKLAVPENSVFGAIKRLRDMSAVEAAAAIAHYKLPFLITKATLGPRAKTEQDIALAIINTMTPNELLANTKTLETWGIKTTPALRAAYEEGLKRTAASTKVQTLKAKKAAEVLAEAGDEDLALKLEAVAEKQIAKQLSIDGNWLILADKSGSMANAIEIARQVAGILAKAVTGNVHLIFFDTGPRYFNVTGKSYEDIKEITRAVRAEGGTSIGTGVNYATVNCLDVDGIAIVSDGQENTYPYFYQEYASYAKKFDKEPTVYFYQCAAGIHSAYDMALDRSCAQAKLLIEKFNVGGADYYSLPNLVSTMRTNRYSLFDEIMETPLATLDAVLKNTKGQKVLTQHAEFATA